MTAEVLRGLPQVDRLARDATLHGVPHAIAVGAARQVLDDLRAEILAGRTTEVPADLTGRVAAQARRLAEGRLVPVINATGVVVHTNLGRAPWSPAARAAAMRVAGYCDLELDLASGARGGRLSGVSAQARHLFGAEAALVVNNNAAAVLLALTALGAGREVVVSRGQLVEIGGSFRVPDVIAAGGALLREVGTTNRTRAADYAAAIGPQTAVLLLVHPSNFRMLGFTESPRREELAALGRAHGVPVVEDLGAGAVAGIHDEPSVREVLASGVDLVCISGDKLLGGPQAGLILGAARWVERLRRHPMYRALRVDKVTLAALEATLGDHAAGRLPPVVEMLTAPLETVLARAERLAASLRHAGCAAAVVEVEALAGGGSLPESPLRSAAVRVPVSRPDVAARALRMGSPAVMARIEDGALVLDLRTVTDPQSEVLSERVASVCRPQ